MGGGRWYSRFTNEKTGSEVVFCFRYTASKWLPEPRLKNLLTSVVVEFSPQASCSPDTEGYSEDHVLLLSTRLMGNPPAADTSFSSCKSVVPSLSVAKVELCDFLMCTNINPGNIRYALEILSVILKFKKHSLALMFHT